MSEIEAWTKKESYGDVDKFIADEIAMMKSAPMSPKRKEFFEDYTQMAMGDLMDKWFPLTLRVRMNSFLRMFAFKLGVYNEAKRFMKKLLYKN